MTTSHVRIESMMKVLRRGALLVVCALVPMWPVSMASGSEARASDPPPTSAGTPARPPEAFSLTISPTRLVLGPDDLDVVQQIQVLNGGTSPVTIEVQKRNFVGRPDGTLDFQEAAPYSASGWMTVEPASFEVAAGATQIVTAAVSVPAAPEPGDHQVALVFLVPAGETGENVKINRGIATPVYITVPGPIDASVSLSDLHASGFATGGPVTVSAEVHSTGTVHRDFRDATPLRLEGAGSSDAFPDFTVVRDATRSISTTWDPPLMCVCHPSLTIVNADGTTQTLTVRVIVFPLPLFGLVVAGLVLLVIARHIVRGRYRARVHQAALALHAPVSRGDV